MAGGANIVSAATLLGGADAGGSQPVGWVEYAFTALDVSATAAVIPSGLASPRKVMFQVVTAAGVLKAVTDAVTIVGGNIVYTFAGGTHAAATDLFRFLCLE
jgi:hypothetical protein